ncbi:MAG TPA: N-acetylmuramic acid 6-phosphate etherase [Pyrinomonadaceae bacterium]|nr:N-acetylmuramic acid 6-phosphate etherase [Pyrinomonadaceae bacterium]
MSTETGVSLPITEQENPRSQNLSSQSTREIVALMNAEDATVAAAVQLVLDDVAQAVDETAARLSKGGKLYYVGTGTSGRLGVLDASECPPTFGVSPELVQGVIAGGYDACHRAVEASEDDENAGRTDLQQRDLTDKDVVIGVAASGKTPYTVGAVRYARSLGAFTVGLTCVPDSPITHAAELSIVPVVGPEVLTGSSRLKAGTAQKMVLNMISTATMVRLGYVSGNRMSNLQARNTKLRERAVRIVMAESGVDQADATEALEASGWKIQDAVDRLKLRPA